MNENSMILKVADITFGVRYRYHILPLLCEDYLCPHGTPEFWLEASDEDILSEREHAEEPVTVAYAESAAILRKFGEKLPAHNAFLLHAAVIEYQGVGYAFSAKSGVGKTTHIRLWQEAFGEEICIVNGDKPVISLSNGKVMAWGTPWCGKERYQKNRSCELKNLCFVERDSVNRIAPLPNEKALSRLMPQILRYKNTASNLMVLDLLDQFFKSVRFFLLGCTPEKEAAVISYEGMRRGNENED